MAGSFHHDVWLLQAKQLPVGATIRVAHRGDRTARPNLVIGHDAGKYWCFCQSCQRGAVHEKSHVMVTGSRAPALSCDLTLPTDMVSIHDTDPYTRDVLAQLLAAKHVDALFLPPLFFSEGRKRLLLDTGMGWLGRDTTGHSPQKWLTYNRSAYLGEREGVEGAYQAGGKAVVVEDPFSYYKVVWALRGPDQPQVYCLLGTSARPALALHLAETASEVCAFLDGDKAGWAGAERLRTQMRPFGVRVLPCCAPDGLDPKDMTAQEIRNHVDFH